MILFLFFFFTLDSEKSNVARFVIPEVEPIRRGRYQCIAANHEGITRSNQVQLDVMCKFLFNSDHLV